MGDVLTAGNQALMQLACEQGDALQRRVPAVYLH